MRFIFLLALLALSFTAPAGIPTRQAIDTLEDEEVSDARTAKFLSTDYDSFIQDVEAYAPQTDMGERLLNHLLATPVKTYETGPYLKAQHVGSFEMSTDCSHDPFLSAALGYCNYLPPNVIKEMLKTINRGKEAIDRLLTDLHSVHDVFQTLFREARCLSYPLTREKITAFQAFTERIRNE